MNIFLALSIIILAVLVVITLPFSAIWAVNTLFATGIAYNFYTWTAALLLIMLFGTPALVRKS